MPSKHHVLISYSKDDEALAKRVLNALGSKGITCWTAFQNLEAGQLWPAAITEAIGECDIFLLILTEHSNTSRHVVRELTQADTLSKKLYCLQTENVQISPSIQYFLSAVHRYEAFNVDLETALHKMATDIARQLGRIDQAGAPTTPTTDLPPAQRPPAPTSRKSRVPVGIALGIIALGIATALYVSRARTREPIANGPSPASPSQETKPENPVVGVKNAGSESTKAQPSPAEQPSPGTPPSIKTQPPIGIQPRTRTFNLSDFALSVNQTGYFSSKEFEIRGLDLAKDLSINFDIKSTRNGGSVRYGIAWNVEPDEFMLFTIHSANGGYYSIGPGRSRRYRPFSRLSEGVIDINAERDFDRLQLQKRGDDLVFLINGREVWRTTSYKLLSNTFAFWVADSSDAVMKAYTVQQ